ncbi:MAG: hypothetical protein Q4A16_09925 [Lautropia sp.]|nr:hypothetical protein [Lautropia sp.]
MMGVLGRTLFKGSLVLLPSLVEMASTTVGIVLQIAPVLLGVLLCARIALLGAWREGWLAEI